MNRSSSTWPSSSTRQRRTLLVVATMATALAAAALLAHQLADDSRRPVPAVADNLARFLPPGAPPPELEAASRRGTFHFEVADSGCRYRGEVTARGTLLWIGSGCSHPPGRPALVPWSRITPFPSGASAEPERIGLVLFLAERTGIASKQRYFDALGRLLLESETPARSASTPLPPHLDELPAAVAERLRLHLGTALPLEVRRERELGRWVHSATWRSPHGLQEVKVLDDGSTLLVVLPDDEPIPVAVARRLRKPARARALLLYGVRARTADTRAGRVVLANGSTIALTSRLASG